MCGCREICKTSPKSGVRKKGKKFIKGESLKGWDARRNMKLLEDLEQVEIDNTKSDQNRKLVRRYVHCRKKKKIIWIKDLRKSDCANYKHSNMALTSGT